MVDAVGSFDLLAAASFPGLSVSVSFSGVVVVATEDVLTMSVVVGEL